MARCKTGILLDIYCRKSPLFLCCEAHPCHLAGILLIPITCTVCIFSSPEHKVLKVSYCDRSLSVVRRHASCVVRQLFSSPEHKVLMVSYCDRALSIVRRRASSVVHKLFYLNIFSSETTHWILTKLHRNDPWVVPYQSCSNGSDWLHR